MDLINLALQVSQQNVQVGQMIEVQVMANADVPTRYLVADIVFGWDPTKLMFVDSSHDGSHPYLWAAVSGVVPTEQDYTGCSEANPPADGDGMYYGYGVLGAQWYISDPVQITKLKFVVLDNFTTTEVRLIPSVTHLTLARTIVYGSNVPGSNTTGTLTDVVIHGSKRGDVTGDGYVNAADLVAMLQGWNGDNMVLDLNDDGVIGSTDMAILLDNWG